MPALKRAPKRIRTRSCGSSVPAPLPLLRPSAVSRLTVGLRHLRTVALVCKRIRGQGRNSILGRGRRKVADAAVGLQHRRPWRVQSHRHVASGGGEIVEIFLPYEIVVS